ncbi:hypothetical protein PHAVU_006G081100 [Phaseolus vulgaris]|uniref:Uncharacterized protein n=1 Tax=Phaseolus vulgaris TaxID=3885 RepID=V7BQQ5_PHAVU|nr:hypothetical protein PHAVU_006G081100g [Phaseolus vulgaris]ESW18906.1 hypothetical protein PHAVU_006G081100g [Phaseolus vulgaris]
MAYRRRQQQGFSKPSFSTFEDDITRNPNPFPPPNDVVEGLASSSSSSSSSLAAKAIRASSARRDSSLSSLYGLSSASASPAAPSEPIPTPPPSSKDSRPYEYTSMKNMNESKNGFWGVLARKAKSIIEDDNVPQQSEMAGVGRSQFPGVASRGKFQNSNHPEENNLKRDGPAFMKGLDAITSSLTHIGGTIGKSLEEGLTIVENRTSDIIHETRKHIRKKPGSFVGQNQERNHSSTVHQQSQWRNQMSPNQTDQELQLKASRDVAMAMAAKAKLLLRELKTVKADLAFAKDRCAQLEEENKILRENRERGDSHEDDDDLIRLQLESLLAEKARLAHENSVFARENRFLREVVEYHQLTMQDVVYFDESNEEVTEVNPLNLPQVPNISLDSITTPTTPQSQSPDPNLDITSELSRDIPSTISGKYVKSSEVIVKDSRSSEATRSISSSTGHDAK